MDTNTLPIGPTIHFNMSTLVARVACTGALVHETQNVDEAFAAMARVTTDAVRLGTGLVGLEMIGHIMVDNDLLVIMTHVQRAHTPDWAENIESARRLVMEVKLISGNPDDRFARGAAIGYLYNSTQPD